MSLTGWFLGLDLTDKVPDASTFSQNRRRRFNVSIVYQKIIVFTSQTQDLELMSGSFLIFPNQY